jgi:AcrR family transcriptional regulator
MSSPESPGPAARLSYGAVIAVAREILAGGGLNAVTLPAVAQRLGVDPEVLHSHVPDRDALVAGLVDGVLDSVELPDGDVINTIDPIDALREISIASYDALLANAELIPSLLEQGVPGERNPSSSPIRRSRFSGAPASRTGRLPAQHPKSCPFIRLDPLLSRLPHRRAPTRT